jgi:hypothetical protein
MTNRRRELLHVSKLEGFKDWLKRKGFVVVSSPPQAIFEVLRYKAKLGGQPYIVYERSHTHGGGKIEHLSTYGDTTRHVLEFLREIKDGRA